MIREVSPEVLQRSHEIARFVNVIEVSCISFRAKRHVSQEAFDAEKVEVSINDSASATVSDDPRALRAIIEFQFQINKPDPKEPMPVISLDAAFELVYKLRKQAPMDLVRVGATEFAAVNSIFNAWPYIRELITSSMSRLGFPPYTLPSLRVIPKAPETSAPTAKPTSEPVQE